MKEWKNEHILENIQILLKQILNSKLLLEQGYDYISLEFKTEEKEKYPYQVRVPVEMRAKKICANSFLTTYYKWLSR